MVLSWRDRWHWISYVVQRVEADKEERALSRKKKPARTTMNPIDVLGAMRQPRPENVVFAELGALCRSPGFIYAIARMCLTDNMIGYVDEATPEDMLKLYEPSRLARNEMNVLIGLWVQGSMDFIEPTRQAIDEYIRLSRALSDEIHQAMNAPIAASMRVLFSGAQDGAETAPDPISSGVSMREAIFYGGESAFAFQYRDFAPVRYGADDAWIVKNMGFSMKEAAVVARSVARVIDQHATEANALVLGDFNKIDSPLDIFTFSADEVARLAKVPLEVCERVLGAFSYPVGDPNKQFVKVDARNTAAILPVMRRSDRYVLFNSVDLYEVLYQAPYFWMLGDKPYGPTAADNRGNFTEEFAQSQLASVFGATRTMLNVKMFRSSVEAGEIDVLVVFSKIAIVLQAKSKQLTAAARQGNDKQIQTDFAAAVQDACDQGMDCAKMLFDPAIKLIGADGQNVERPEVEKVFVVCLVADHYPALAAQTRQYLKFEPVAHVASPLVIDVFLLDAMVEMLDSPLHFLNYLDRRCEYAEKLMSSHELNILGFHLSHNLWMNEEANLFHLWDDFGIDLELSMLARREGLAAPWTPPGLLTLLDNTALGRLLKAIENEPNPAMVELGFSILSMSSDSVQQGSAAIDEISRLARLDGNAHDFTVQMQNGVGLTFHSSPRPGDAARAHLLDHCKRRKYVQHATRWFGVLIDPASGNMRFGAMLDEPWTQDDELDTATAHMSQRSNVSHTEFKKLTVARTQSKTGRNDPCPCHSGKKYKRCCGS
jgi:hypothetical protein